MPDERKAWDGHTRVLGVDTSTNPAEQSTRLLSGAVNRVFRKGNNSTRPIISALKHTFEDAETERVFRKGAINGCFGYTAWGDFAQSCLVVSVHDRLLQGIVTGSVVYFKTLMKGLQSGYMQSWMVQTHDRLYFQNGIQQAVGWDGVNAPYFVPGVSEEGMPIGTVMAYNNGRLVVFTDDNYAIVSDYIYGNGIKDTRGVEKFTERYLQNDLQAIGTPAEYGPVCAAFSIPKPESANGQGDLLVLCERGAYTLDLTGLREDWMFKGIQKRVLKGRGGVGAFAVCEANTDVWFVTSEGSISSYRFERSEQEKLLGTTSLSREVQDYLKYTHASRLRYSSMILCNNRLLTSTAIQMRASELGGAHRFGLGVVSLDFDKGSTTGPSTGFSWDGLWTGVRPVQLVNLYENSSTRSIVVSYDPDGNNRIYEVTDRFGDDEGEGFLSPIVSSYITPQLFEQLEPTEQPVHRTLHNVALETSGIVSSALVTVSYRGGSRKRWWHLHGPIEKGVVPDEGWLPGCLPNYGDSAGDINTGNPLRSDVTENGELAFVAPSFQVKVDIEGAATVNVLQAVCNITAKPQKVSCPKVTPGLTSKEPPRLTENNLFDYTIQKP